MTDRPRVRAWRRDGNIYRWVADLGEWTDLEYEMRFNGAGTCSLTLPWRSASKLGKAHVLTFDYKDFPRYTARFALDSPQETVTSRREVRAVRQVTGVDALSYLDIAGYPNPQRAAGAQDVTHYRQSGDAETVLRDFIQANYVLRLQRPLDIATSQNRGASTTVNSRFENVLTTATTKATAANLGLRMGLVTPVDKPKAATASMRLEFFALADKSKTVKLSRKTGTLRSWKQSDQAPTATRAIVLGGGEGTARVVRVVIDTAVEAAWDVVLETVVDARDESDVTVLDQRGKEALLEAAQKSSFEMETVLPEGIRPGKHFGLGDLVHVDLGLSTETVTKERIGAFRVKSSAQSGTTVELVPGNPDSTDPLFGYAQIVRGLRREVAALKMEK